MANNKRIIYSLIFLAILLFGVVSFINFKGSDNEFEGEDVVSTRKDFEYEGKDYVFDYSKQVVMVCGLDSFDNNVGDGYTNDKLADFILLFVIDNENKKVTPIQINRDSMVNYNVLGIKGEIVSSSYGQIALSHSYGDGGLSSLCNVKDAVKELFFNAHIDYYLSLTMDAVGAMNDLVGGITVYMEDDLSMIDPAFIKGEYVKLMGEQALKYVRSRGGLEDSTNLSRQKRQRSYLKELFSVFSEKSGDDSFSFRAFETISPMMCSSANVDDIRYLTEKIRTYDFEDILVVDGQAIKGDTYMEYHIDENSLKEIASKTMFKVIE